MDNLKALGRGTQLMAVSAVLLLIDSFFRWQEIDFGPISGGVSAWDNFLGILMGILTIVLIARIAARTAAVDVPIPLSFATTSFVLGILIAIFAVLKNLTDDYSTIWSYIGVVLAILIAVGAWMEVQEAGGMETLRNEASALGGGGAASGGAGGAEASAAAPAAPAEAATPTPPAAPEPMTPAPAAPAAEAAPEPPDAPSYAAGGAMDDAADAASEAGDDLTDGPSTGTGA